MYLTDDIFHTWCVRCRYLFPRYKTKGNISLIRSPPILNIQHNTTSRKHLR